MFFILLAVISIFGGDVKAEPLASQKTPSMVVHLLDYMAKDYGGAVKDGQVISQSEYKEQLEFAEIIYTTAHALPQFSTDKNFTSNIDKFFNSVKKKASETEISSLARTLQMDAIRLAKIEIAPIHWPDMEKGRALFQQNCTSCHGASGHGDGAAGVALDPKPANFHNKELIWSSAPFKFYNTIRLGVPGTGMVGFSAFTDEEVWNLAFYLKSLGYEGVNPSEIGTALSLKDVSSLTDEEIVNQLKLEKDKASAVLASIRTKSKSDMPDNEHPLDVAERFLGESLASAHTGDFSGATALALRSYLEGIEPVEPKMKANIPGSVPRIEGLMSDYRASLGRKDSFEKISLLKEKVSADIKSIKDQLAENKMSPSVAFGAAFSIFLREGFEAVLIIIVLVSILKAMGQTEAIRWVHLGWIIALSLGVLFWIVSGFALAMSGMSRELMEGSISLLAVIVLLYVGFWLHRYTEMKKWRTFLESKLKSGLTTKSYMALALVSFMAVFREAFEVVLFLRAIWVDLDPSGQRIAGFGVITSFIFLMGFSYLAITGSKKLPLQKLFQICSWTMIVLAFILAGKGMHSLQEAGFSSVTGISMMPRLDLVGLFPSVETVAAQVVIFCIFAFLFYSDRSKESVSA